MNIDDYIEHLESTIRACPIIARGTCKIPLASFRRGNSVPDFFPDVPLKFRPYLHQEEAFKRLTGPSPTSTIVATAELGWPALKMAFLNKKEMPYQDVFNRTGWQVFQIEDMLADPESHLPMLDN